MERQLTPKLERTGRAKPRRIVGDLPRGLGVRCVRLSQIELPLRFT